MSIETCSTERIIFTDEATFLRTFASINQLMKFRVIQYPAEVCTPEAEKYGIAPFVIEFEGLMTPKEKALEVIRRDMSKGKYTLFSREEIIRIHFNILADSLDLQKLHKTEPKPGKQAESKAESKNKPESTSKSGPKSTPESTSTAKPVIKGLDLEKYIEDNVSPKGGVYPPDTRISLSDPIEYTYYVTVPETGGVKGLSEKEYEKFMKSRGHSHLYPPGRYQVLRCPRVMERMTLHIDVSPVTGERLNHSYREHLEFLARQGKGEHLEGTLISGIVPDDMVVSANIDKYRELQARIGECAKNSVEEEKYFKEVENLLTEMSDTELATIGFCSKSTKSAEKRLRELNAKMCGAPIKHKPPVEPKTEPIRKLPIYVYVSPKSDVSLPPDRVRYYVSNPKTDKVTSMGYVQYCKFMKMKRINPFNPPEKYMVTCREYVPEEEILIMDNSTKVRGVLRHGLYEHYEFVLRTGGAGKPYEVEEARKKLPRALSLTPHLPSYELPDAADAADIDIADYQKAIVEAWKKTPRKGDEEIEESDEVEESEEVEEKTDDFTS